MGALSLFTKKREYTPFMDHLYEKYKVKDMDETNWLWKRQAFVKVISARNLFFQRL